LATQRLAGFLADFSHFFPPQVPSKHCRTEKNPTPSENWIDGCCFYYFVRNSLTALRKLYVIADKKEQKHDYFTT